MSFEPISRYQLIIGRREQRDELTLKIELKNEVKDRDSLADELNQKFQGICRLKIDKIDFVEPGTFPDKYQTIVDERKWD